jgi:uroporphyrinogen-III decarboxylase
MLVEAVWALLSGQGIPGARGDSQLAIRANFGTVVVATTFGVEARPLPHTPPWIVDHLTREQAARAIQKLDPAAAPQRGLAPEALERSAYFARQLAGKARVFNINNQSPLDIAHQVRGEDLLYDLYDDAAFVHDLLEACTQAYIAMARAFKHVLDEPLDRTYSGASYMVRCGTHAADDSATLLSPEHFAEFGLPYDCKAFAPFGGGSIHFCGNAQHILDGYLAAPEVKAINLGQPKLYDPAELMPRLLAAKKVYVGNWPVHSGEDLDAYIQRIMDALGHRREGMLLNLAGWEFGIPPDEVADRWYAWQREN